MGHENGAVAFISARFEEFEKDHRQRIIHLPKFLIGPVSERDLNDAAKFHALSKTLEADILNEFDKWSPEVAGEIAAFLWIKYPCETAEWIDMPSRWDPDPDRVEDMEKIIRELRPLGSQELLGKFR